MQTRSLYKFWKKRMESYIRIVHACPCFQTDKSDETAGSFKTIRVRLARPLSQDALENYFENKRKSGGGDIESCTVTRGNEQGTQEALITFSDFTGKFSVYKKTSRCVAIKCHCKQTKHVDKFEYLYA